MAVIAGDGSAEYSLVTLADFDFGERHFGQNRYLWMQHLLSSAHKSLYVSRQVVGSPGCPCPLWRVLPVGVGTLLLLWCAWAVLVAGARLHPPVRLVGGLHGPTGFGVAGVATPDEPRD